MTNIKPIIAGILAVFIWAVIPCLVKTGTETLPVSFFLFARFLIASVFMIYWLPRVLRKVTKLKFWIWLLLLLDLGANYFFQAIAMKELPVSWYIVIFSLNPVLSLLLLRVPVTKSLVSAVIISMIGTFCFLNFNEMNLHIGLLAVSSLIIGMLTWVIYTFMIKTFQTVYSDIEVTTLTNFVSLLATFLIWCSFGFEIATPNSHEMISVFVLGIGTVLAYALYSYSMRLTPTIGVMSQYLEPIFGVAAAYFMFNESLNLLQFVGATSIIVAMSRLSVEH